MSLPDLIEVLPLAQPVWSEVTVPGSKSITNRALLLAALAAGRTVLRGGLWSEDTEVMVDCLSRLGFRVDVLPEASEMGNRTLVVDGQAGRIPHGGTPAEPLELFVGNAGTAARFLSAFCCLGQGVYRLSGVPRMGERPQAALFAALRELGYRVDTPNDRLPAVIHGGGPRAGRCRIGLGDSSQFASALTLCARAGGWDVEVQDPQGEESSYLEMTRRLVAQFPSQGGEYAIEPDASSGSYFWAAGWLAPGSCLPGLASEIGEWGPKSGRHGIARRVAARYRRGPQREGESLVNVAGWPETDWQIDERFPDYLPLPERVSRQADLGDSIMTAAALAAVGDRTVRFEDLGRLRLQECERVQALRTELARCGGRISEEGDTLVISPAPGGLHGAEIETYGDHRMAMVFTILGLKVPGIRIKNPACVRKTFPGFYSKLAALAPSGLGARFRDGRTGRILTGPSLEVGVGSQGPAGG